MELKKTWPVERDVVRRGGGSGWLYVILVVGLLMIGTGVFLNSERGSAWIADAPEILVEQLPEFQESSETSETSNEIDQGFRDASASGNWPGALEYASTYVERWPDDYYGYVICGYASWNLDDCGAAVVDFNTVNDLAPSYSYAYWAQSFCQLFLGNAVSAEESARMAVETSGDGYDRYLADIQAGWFAYRGQDYATAAARFEKAGRFEDADSYALVGLWLSLTMDGKDASDVLDQTAKQNSDRDWLLTRVLDLFAGDLPARTFLTETDHDPAAYFYLAQYRLVQGEEGEVREALERAALGTSATFIEVPMARQMVRDRNE